MTWEREKSLAFVGRDGGVGNMFGENGELSTRVALDGRDKTCSGDKILSSKGKLDLRKKSREVEGPGRGNDAEEMMW